MALLAPIRTGFSIKLKPKHKVGRVAGCQLRLTFREVSGEHALIEWSGSVWQLTDLGSSNGTLLNGRRLPPNQVVPLTLGDRLSFGHLDLTYVFKDDSAPE